MPLLHPSSNQLTFIYEKWLHSGSATFHTSIISRHQRCISAWQEECSVSRLPKDTALLRVLSLSPGVQGMSSVLGRQHRLSRRGRSSFCITSLCHSGPESKQGSKGQEEYFGAHLSPKASRCSST